MRICVLIPNEDVVAQAGVRIRYHRIQQLIAAQGHELELRPIDSFQTRAAFTHDAYIVSKVYDARSLVVARLLADTQILCGADLFDDYFTQGGDTRLVRFQLWMESFAASAKFMLCSTPAMQAVADAFAPGVPNFVMNDPSSPVDVARMSASLERRLVEARESRVLRVGWFGMGDNPYFPVGLYDLAHFADHLAALRQGGYEVALSILTNRRALTPENLAMLSRLPVPYDIEEWSVDAETRLIADSLVCFLPVNAQNFSIAKSLNRAVSCLALGAQVLSPGFPLYRPLGGFIYRDAAALLADLDAGTLAVRPDTLPQLVDTLETWADPAGEASRFVSFFQGIASGAPIPPREGAQPTAVVIHGQRSQGDTHKFAQKLRMLSVASPFSRLKLNFDARFEFTAGEPGIDAYVSEKWAMKLPRRVQSILSEHGKILDTVYRRVDLSAVPGAPQFPANALGRMNGVASITASYAPTMRAVEATLKFLFPGVACYLSEGSRLPWRAAPESPAAASERLAS